MFFAHNTITIFLIEITTKVSFIAENPHLIESNDRESRLIINRKYSGCAVTDFWNFLELLCNGEQREIQKIVSSFSDRSTGKGWWIRRTGLPGTGGEKVKVDTK
jgi:hypothetical protein